MPTTTTIGGRTYEVYRRREGSRGNAAVALPEGQQLTPAMRQAILKAGRMLGVDAVAVWAGDEVIALLSVR